MVRLCIRTTNAVVYARASNVPWKMTLVLTVKASIRARRCAGLICAVFAIAIVIIHIYERNEFAGAETPKHGLFITRYILGLVEVCIFRRNTTHLCIHTCAQGDDKKEPCPKHHGSWPTDLGGSTYLTPRVIPRKLGSSIPSRCLGM